MHIWYADPVTEHVTDHMPITLSTTCRPRYRPHTDHLTDHIPIDVTDHMPTTLPGATYRKLGGGGGGGGRGGRGVGADKEER